MPNNMTKITKIICTHRERLSHPHLIDLGSQISIWRAGGSSYPTTERSQGKLPATDAGTCRFGAHPSSASYWKLCAISDETSGYFVCCYFCGRVFPHRLWPV